MVTTIAMPISRLDFLQRIFAQLDMMHCDAKDINLLCYVDGSHELYQKVHTYVTNSKFNERLCVYRRKGLPNVNHIPYRRKRIAAIHNEMKEIINYCDYVFLLEDDTLIPLNTMEKLLKAYTYYPFAGFISGMQIGRWGFTVPGIWKVDNPYDVKTISSCLPKAGSIEEHQPMGGDIEEIDAAGFYCCITKMENYKSCRFEPFDTILGPDVSYGLHLRRQGLKNYVDWSINTSHLTKRGEIKINNTALQKITFRKITESKGEWKQEVI